MKALGLAAGTAAAFGSIRSPSATATLYLGGTEATNCIYYNSGPVEVALKMGPPYTAQDIEKLLKGGNNDLAGAQQYAAEYPNNSDLPTLTVAIQGWNAAVKVAMTALPVATDPVGYLLSERSAIINKMLAKLNGSPVSISTQQKAIQGYISSAQTAANSGMAMTAVGAVPGSGNPSYIFNAKKNELVARAGGPSTTKDYAAALKGDTDKLLVAAQGYATAAGDIATCSGNVPSQRIGNREPMRECAIVPMSTVATWRPNAEIATGAERIDDPQAFSDVRDAGQRVSFASGAGFAG